LSCRNKNTYTYSDFCGAGQNRIYIRSITCLGEISGRSYYEIEMIEKIQTEALLKLIRQAGRAILEIYRQDFKVQIKPDFTPVTLADHKANEILAQGLTAFFPDIPIITEENDQIPYSQRKAWSRFWLVDPLDGTKEFIKRNGEFAINLALIQEKHPVFGIIHVPVSDITYYGKKDKGCFKVTGNQDPESLNPSRQKEKNKVTVVGSRSYLSPEVYSFVNKLRQEFREVELIQMGSAIKFGLIAEGKADFYLRTGRTMEWDTAAGQVIVAECGKQVYDYKTGEPLEYNKVSLVNPWFIVK
jgi:3'(2'), 5'-bisphosphate nucleotidase